ncbi:hypothetical protein [uncultured Enterovirga sp.]|uniref:hypothetical protein n=1 Tax=uncultured Enterovirga sp. TaxID=2026352 RepID=UPI0035CC7BEF
MTRLTTLILSAGLIAASVPALAEHGGDREAAGGAFMSSYSRSPYAAAGAPTSAYATPAPSYAEPEATGSVTPRARRSRPVR